MYKVIYICFVLTKLTKHISIMQITDEVLDLLRQDYQLRIEISYKMKIREVNVYRWATRRSIPKWFEKEVMTIISNYLKDKQ